ncbi:hypothetical protein DIPPA_70034 [Diplonema papillatum]|nr:hypothetical protein DIPPA_70034 [Diplonema papillatum]
MCGCWELARPPEHAVSAGAFYDTFRGRTSSSRRPRCEVKPHIAPRAASWGRSPLRRPPGHLLLSRSQGRTPHRRTRRPPPGAASAHSTADPSATARNMRTILVRSRLFSFLSLRVAIRLFAFSCCVSGMAL